MAFRAILVLTLALGLLRCIVTELTGSDSMLLPVRGFLSTLAGWSNL
jgi:hypothetical protein